MSVGIGTQFAASLAPDQTQTWFTYGWDPNHFLIWSILPTNSPDQVRPERVHIAYEATGVTHFLTIANTGPWPASSEANYYFKTIIPEGEWRNLGPLTSAAASHDACATTLQPSRCLTFRGWTPRRGTSRKKTT
ncbi:MAG TPA: hypothetical protein VG206_08200 [Terriglobia bacterium]|nr:hypothetical protein [Terriglobia bacterium]